MADDELDWLGEDYEPPPPRPPDLAQAQAREELRRFFSTRKSQVFFSRQVEVMHEGQFIHWVTNRALKDLIRAGELKSAYMPMAGGGNMHVIWHKGLRYPVRPTQRLMRLVEEYAAPNISGAIGLQGEYLVLEGLARHQFVMQGRGTRSYAGTTWLETEHNLDFIFEREGLAYGVEVKNMLAYMDHKELEVKLQLCEALGLIPLFVCRMLPKPWINEIIEAGGFALIMKWQLYPWAHRDLAKKVAKELELPVDSPRALEHGTTMRFVKWHDKRVISERKSQKGS